jgi:hypothetical protein
MKKARVIGTDEEEVYNHTRHGWHKAAFFSLPKRTGIYERCRRRRRRRRR